MKKSLARKILMSVLTGTLLMSSSIALASEPIYGKKSDSDSVTGGNVHISEGSFIKPIYGGYSGYWNAVSNIVNIYGGDFNSSDIYGGFSKEGESESNIVAINGGIFYGGLTICGGYSGNSNGKSIGNLVSISGNANLTRAHLRGGNSIDKSIYGGAATPNVLNIGLSEKAIDTLGNLGVNTTGFTVGSWKGNIKSIAGFDWINFAYVEWEKDDTIVTAKNLELKDTKITVTTVNVVSGTALANGDKMNLISVTNNMSGSISNNGEQVVVNRGIAERFNAFVEQDKNNIYLRLDDGSNHNESIPARNDQVLVLGESRAAAVAFTNQSSELIETGLNALARDNEKDTKVFAAVYGNHSEYETGSHVNVNGWSGIVGVGKTNADGLTVGAFFENGEGNYSTHNIFTNDYIRGDGEACYNGGGLLVRKDNANGVYAEASLRAGNLQNELRNAVRNGSELTGYDIDTFYYGAHVGIGKVIPRGNDGDSIDVYGKFIYTHHDGETFDIGGTATKFDSVESERLRLGFRINEVQTNKLSMYYGAAWEYEFNGDAYDKIASFDLETPSLEGSAVIGEIGTHFKVSDKWSIDLNGRAYVGQREGFSGSVQANYAF